MSKIRDAWLRKFATQLPLGIDIKDDDGNVIHKSIGDPKTHMITLYSAWLGKGSGGSTGGNTGTGDGGNTGGDTGGTTNPGHETVGDDVYPGDVNKGELTKRFKLWQGPSKPNEDTTVTFNQDLGENLDGLGDGLQAQLSMVETPYLGGKALTQRSMNVSSLKNNNWDFQTDIPAPISIKKGRLASKDNISIKVNASNNKILYPSRILTIASFTTAPDYPGSVVSRDIPGSLLDLSGCWVPAHVNATSFQIWKDGSGSRNGQRLVVTKDGVKVSSGLLGNDIVTVNDLKPSTGYSKGTFKIHYEDASGNIMSNEADIQTFSTKEEYAEPESIYNISTVYETPTVFSDGIVLQFVENTDLNGRIMGVLNSDNKLVAMSDLKNTYIYVGGLESDHVYSDYKFVIFNEHEISDTDSVVSPSIDFQYNADGNMLLHPTQGVIKNADGTILATYDIVLNYINSYTVQSETTQIDPQDILFSGSSSTVQLRNVSKNFDNISDGLVINFDEYTSSLAYSPIIRIKLSDLNLPKSIKISKKNIFSGVTQVDISNKFQGATNQAFTAGYQAFKDNKWQDVPSNMNKWGLKTTTCDAKLTFQNGSIILESNVHMTRSGYSGESIIHFQIASVTTYKEGE